MSRLRLSLLLICLSVALLLGNRNIFGDERLHRPFFLQPLHLLPSFALHRDYFLYGGESPSVMQGLGILVHSLNHESNLTFFGKLFATSVLRDQMHQLHCVTHSTLFAPREPASDAVDDAPLIILGLPRTGTTFFHQLVAQDSSQFRAPRFHEYMSACPKPSPASERSLLERLRVYMQDVKANALRVLLPKLASQHYISAETPEEDVVPLGHVMASAMYPTTFHLPAYATHLAELDYAPAVAYLRAYLTYLRYDPRPYVLKTPQHLFLIDAVLQVFPRARFVWLHRDPAQSVPSLVSVVQALVSIGSNAISDPGFARQVMDTTVDLWKRGLQRALASRRHIPQGRLVDVGFDQLNDDPIGVVKRVYAQLGLVLTNQSLARMEDFVLANRRGVKFGQHIVTLSPSEREHVARQFDFYNWRGFAGA